MTDLLLSGILSLPWSLLASLPPDVEVPLPLLFGAIPVVSAELLEAELAAGRGVPGPPGLLWANASGLETRKAAIVTAKTVGLMVGLQIQKTSPGKTSGTDVCSEATSSSEAPRG